MKRTQMVLAGIAFVLAIAFTLHAQRITGPVGAVSLDDTNVDWNSLSDTEVELRAIESTRPIPAAAVSSLGTFYSAQNPDWPPLPGNIDNVPCWPLDTNLFLLDDRAVNYAAPLKPAIKAGKMMAMDDPSPGDGGGSGTNTYSPSYQTPLNYGTNLWIAKVGIVSSNLAGTISNSQPYISYEIQSRTNLAQSDWASEGFIIGSAITNWTPMSVMRGSRTNLFVRIRSWADTQGVGIPDWWQLQYFGYVGIDPNADPDGDGFPNIQEYLMGTDPTVFNTPPAPSNFLAVRTNGTNVVLSWNPSHGGVLNYVIYRGVFNLNTFGFDFQQIAQVSAATTNFQDIGVANTDWRTVYEIKVNYPGGPSAMSGSSSILSAAPTPTFDIPITARLVRNSIGRWQLMFSSIPANVQTIALSWYTYSYYNSVFLHLRETENISVSNINNGSLVISDTDATNNLGNVLYVQGVGTNNSLGAMSLAGFVYPDAPCFVDGRQHLKQNLLFELRAATLSQPLGYPGASSTNHVESSIFSLTQMSEFYGSVPYTAMNDLWPFTANYDFHQLLYDTNTSVATNFIWRTNLVTVPAPAVLGVGEPYWIAQNPNTLSDVGVNVSYITTNTLISFQANAYNLFGLQITAAWTQLYNLATGIQFGVVTNFPGNSFEIGGNIGIPWIRTDTAVPTLQTPSYYFVPVATPGPLLPTNSTPIQYYPLPASSDFAATNQTPMMIGSVGQPMVVGGWAKYPIQGTSPSKYAYLGQYFVTNAFLLNSNGVVTTNSAGIVSPYGEFLPTQVGKAALVTMPDIDPPYQQGTCAVQVVRLQLDANHDGNMDLSLSGPDTTSPSQPYVFWANNNFDRNVLDADDNAYYDDDVEAAPESDCNYLSGLGQRIIPCQRDLEDFARLWISGVTTNLLAALPAGSTVTLSWGDVGNPNPNNPTIDLFTAAVANGGIGYLTNSTIAAHQVDPQYSPHIHRLGPGQSIQLNTSLFGQTGNWLGNYFIWCGVASGNGTLTLTIADGNGNVFGQSSVYIQIKDIKQMYERWSVGDSPSRAPVSTAYPVQDSTTPQGFQFPAPWNSNTPYILLVHGWNDDIWAKDRFAECAFKRLYWQGYQGRFGSFRWPTTFGFSDSYWKALTDPRNYDNGESNAWHSAAGLLNLVTQLHGTYGNKVYLLAHSMGNVVTGEALRLAGNNQLVNTYVASQAALPAHNYDSTVTTPYLLPFTYTYPTGPLNLLGSGNYGPRAPNIYGNRLTNNIAAVGRRINFYNVNDYALAMPRWGFDQILKPDGSYLYTGPLNDPSPWNKFGLVFNDGATNMFDIVNSLDDRYEVMAYAAPSYSTALGATPGITTFDDRLDLTTIWPTDSSGHSYGDHLWHSAQFRGDCWQEWNYWNTLLRSGSKGFNIQNP